MFIDYDFPVDIAYGSSGGPRFLTEIVSLTSGYEKRNSAWSQARCEFDASTGIQSQEDLYNLISFYRAVGGQLYSFRFRDYSDYSTASDGISNPGFNDQFIEFGDGSTTEFQLCKRYTIGPIEHKRIITKPVEDSVVVSLDGVELTTGFSINDTTGIITFDVAPGDDVQINAGFYFDVPVRFDISQLEVRLDTYQAGSASVPLIEVRE